MASQTETGSDQRVQLEHRDILSIVLGVVLAMFIAALDQTIVSTALPTIGQELGDFEHMSWVASIYLLAATAVTPLYGKLSDIYGRRIVLLSGIATFVVGSLACALAPTMFLLIAARALQGMGGGGLISLAQTIIADVVAPRERGRYQVYIAGVFMMSSLTGPLLGGLMTQYLHWSFIFWINLPLGFLAFAMSRRALRKLPRHDRKHRLDVLGAVLMTGATISLMLGLSYGSQSGHWLSGDVAGLFAVSLLLWIGFALRLKWAEEPLIPLDVLGNQVVRTGMLAACFGMGTYIGLNIYMPIYFETILHLNAEQSGRALIPLMVGTVIGATTSGRVMLHLRRYTLLPKSGLVVAFVSIVILALWAPTLTFWEFEAMLALVSLGLGTLLPVTTVAIQNAVAPHQLGTTTGAMNFFRQLGGALIVTAFAALLFSSPVTLEGGSAAPLHDMVTPERFRLLFFAAGGGFFLAFCFLLMMEERPLRGRSPS
jgi:EmrB/QacA subfamily drug resistance transporter